MRVWVFMAGSWALVIWCVGNLQHQRPAAMGRKSLIAWQGAAPAGWPPGWHARAVDWRLRGALAWKPTPRSEEHTSELQSLMRISYAVFCLKKKKENTQKFNKIS